MTNSHPYQNQMIQDRYGLQVAARLSDAADELPHDISERLRVARMQALGKRKVVKTRTASSVTVSGGAGALTYGSDDASWWDRIASAIPLIALIVGLVAINVVQNDNRAKEVAEVDAALLTDDLPPAAYTDPGFAQFLKSNHDQIQ